MHACMGPDRRCRRGRAQRTVVKGRGGSAASGECPSLGDVGARSGDVVVIVGRWREVSVQSTGGGRTRREDPGRGEDVDPSRGQGHDARGCEVRMSMAASSFSGSSCVVATNSLKLIGSNPNQRRIPSRHYNPKRQHIPAHPEPPDAVWHLDSPPGATGHEGPPLHSSFVHVSRPASLL